MKKFFNKIADKIDSVDGSKSNVMLGRHLLVGQHNVRVESLLGEGGFASIYTVRDATSRAAFALKHVRMHGESDAIEDVQNEVAVMKQLKGHPNILALQAVAYAGTQGQEDEAFLLLDLCTDNLVDYVRRHGNRLEPRAALAVFADVCQGVAWMHNQPTPLAHRDLKAENVLLGPSRQWVLCDFGSSTTRAQSYDTERARALEEERIRKTTTPAYRAPEMWDLLTRERIDTKVDVWALGCLLYYLLFGKLPFSGENGLPALNGAYDMPRDMPPGMPASLPALIRELLTADPKERPDIETVLDRVRAAQESMGGAADSGGAAVGTAAAASTRPRSPGPEAAAAARPGSAQANGGASALPSRTSSGGVGPAAAAAAAAAVAAVATNSGPATPGPSASPPPEPSDFDPFGLSSGGSTPVSGAGFFPSPQQQQQQPHVPAGSNASLASRRGVAQPAAGAAVAATPVGARGTQASSSTSAPTIRRESSNDWPGPTPQQQQRTPAPTASTPAVALPDPFALEETPGGGGGGGGARSVRRERGFSNTAFDTPPPPPQQQQQQRAPLSRDVGFSTKAFDRNTRAGKPATPAAAGSGSGSGDPFAFAGGLASAATPVQQQQRRHTVPAASRPAPLPPSMSNSSIGSGTNKLQQQGGGAAPVHNVTASGSGTGSVGDVPTGFRPLPRAEAAKKQPSSELGKADADPFATFTNGLLPPKKVQAPALQPMRPVSSTGMPGSKSAFGLLPQPAAAGGLWRTVSDPPPLEHWVSFSNM